MEIMDYFSIITTARLHQPLKFVFGEGPIPSSVIVVIFQVAVQISDGTYKARLVPAIQNGTQVVVRLNSAWYVPQVPTSIATPCGGDRLG